MLEAVKKLSDGDGFTMKNHKLVEYKSGYQVATHGVEVTTIEACVEAVVSMDGNAGVWFSDGIYYVDYSFRVPTLRDALEIGRAWNQISIFQWSKGICRLCTDGSIMVF